MIARWKAILAAAAVAGGSAAAIWTAMQAAAPTADCAEFATIAARVNDPQRKRSWFMAVRAGEFPPAAVVSVAGDERVLGDCDVPTRTCTIQPQGCSAKIEWHFDFSPLVTIGANDWRLVWVKGHPYHAKALKYWTEESASTRRFFWSHKEAFQTCLANTTPANCWTMFKPFASARLKTKAGATYKYFCREGRLYGPYGDWIGAQPGIGGDQACPVGELTGGDLAQIQTFDLLDEVGLDMDAADEEWTENDLEL